MVISVLHRSIFLIDFRSVNRIHSFVTFRGDIHASTNISKLRSGDLQAIGLAGYRVPGELAELVSETEVG